MGKKVNTYLPDEVVAKIEFLSNLWGPIKPLGTSAVISEAINRVYALEYCEVANCDSFDLVQAEEAERTKEKPKPAKRKAKAS